MTNMIGYYSGKSQVVHLMRQGGCISLQLPVQLRANNQYDNNMVIFLK